MSAVNGLGCMDHGELRRMAHISCAAQPRNHVRSHMHPLVPEYPADWTGEPGGELYLALERCRTDRFGGEGGRAHSRGGAVWLCVMGGGLC
jgi:hypothetical protein